MKRRQFIQSLAASSLVAAAPRADAERATAQPLLANDYVTVYESPHPDKVFAYSPGLAKLENGHLVATMDQGLRGDAKELIGAKVVDGKTWIGKIYTSADRGKTWTHRSDMPLQHARPFAAGGSVYVLGHANDLGVMRSDDDGQTWGGPFWLTEGQRWHQAPCNVHYTKGRVYLVMERDTDPPFNMWPVSVFAPVLMSADVNADLSLRSSWTFSSELTFKDVMAQEGAPNLLGVPFFATGNTTPNQPGTDRPMAPIGWLETNVVQFVDPDHVWYDPAGRTFHLWMRAHTGTTNLAAIAKAVEGEDGSITVSVEHAPSGEPMIFVPCPGGQMKFHILYDEVTKLFWLLSSQATDSMTRPDRLPANRFNLPNNERHRLVLHFSRNCVDWCFAGRVPDSGEYGQGRHYASMVIDGDDLHVLSRSGDERAADAHNGNIITFHTVKDFRALVY